MASGTSGTDDQHLPSAEDRPAPLTAYSALYRVIVANPAMTTVMCFLYGLGAGVFPVLAMLPPHRPPHWAWSILGTLFAPFIYGMMLHDAMNRWWKAFVFLGAALIGWLWSVWVIPGNYWRTGLMQTAGTLMLVAWGVFVYVRLLRRKVRPVRD